MRKKHHLKDLLRTRAFLEREKKDFHSKQIWEDCEKTDEHYVSFMKLQKILTKAYQNLAKNI